VRCARAADGQQPSLGGSELWWRNRDELWVCADADGRRHLHVSLDPSLTFTPSNYLGVIRRGT
jgi:hypothetical protein